jgi:uroporphyrinogen decarboxylase
MEFITMNSRERFLAALRGDALDRLPCGSCARPGAICRVSRAARRAQLLGRLPEPGAVHRAALEPLDRYALDAAIVFSDILVVPLAMGSA